MNPPTIPRWLPVAILVTALLSLLSISYRYRVEERNRAVSIAVEYETIESFAAAQGKSMDEALLQLKAQGLGSVVLSEEYVVDMINSGHGDLRSGLFVVDQQADRARLMRAFGIRFPRFIAGRFPSESVFALDFRSLSPTTIRATPVGLNPDQCATIKKAGLAIVARMANPPGVSSNYVRQTLDWAHELGATIFLPMGDQVLGRREALKDMTDELEKLGMLYASPEFSKLGGDENVLQMVPASVVRLHSAQAAELDKLRPDEAVERYSLAARERGMRVLLVRPLSFAAPTPLASLDDFIRRIDKDCTNQGLERGTAHPFEDPKVPTWLFLLIGLSIVPTVYFVGATFVRNRSLQIGVLVLATAIGGLAVTHHGRPYTALLAAIAFPIAAFIVLDSMKPPAKDPWLSTIILFVVVSLVSVVGGLAVAGLLNELPYFIRAAQFEGVKLAVFLPIAVVAIYFLMRGTDLKAAFKNPMTWASALVAILILAALAFMSSRTGNDNPAGVSDLELKMRFLLDQILLVRPRTKEFMVGHPLLVIGIGMLLAGRRRREEVSPEGPEPPALSSSGAQAIAARGGGLTAALFLAGGAIGQTDVVNTMCHIHTPVVLSLMRVGVGMVAGCIIGLAVWAVAKRWLPAGD